MNQSSPLSKQRETCVTSGQRQEIEYGRNKHCKRVEGIKGPEATMGRPRPPQIREGIHTLSSGKMEAVKSFHQIHIMEMFSYKRPIDRVPHRRPL